MNTNSNTNEKFSDQTALREKEGVSKKNETIYFDYSGESDNGLIEIEITIVTISKDGNETSDKIDKTNGPAKMTISAMISAIILLGLLIFRRHKTRRMPKYEIENMPLIEKFD